METSNILFNMLFARMRYPDLPPNEQFKAGLIGGATGSLPVGAVLSSKYMDMQKQRLPHVDKLPDAGTGDGDDVIKRSCPDIEKLMAIRFDEIDAFLKDKSSAAKIKKILQPLADGTIDAGDLEKIREDWYKLFGRGLIRQLKKEATIHRKLSSMYEYLAKAPAKDWEQYARCVISGQLTEGFAKNLLLPLASEPELESHE